jgi:4-amino-4-deoxy-L-arabinose transferase-like glycosyltransferase
MFTVQKRYIYIGIILLGSFLRLFLLDTIPPGLHGDEAVTGYTAYSLLKTGKELSGASRLVGFTDTNIGGTFPSVLSWVLVPFVFLLGLHPYVDRLPSALAGILCIILMYEIAKKLLQDKTAALIAAFLLAVNPWAIHLSRQGLLESLTLCFVLAGTYFFLNAEKNIGGYMLAFVLFSLSLYTYDATRIFAACMIVLLMLYKWKSIRKIRFRFFASSFIFICIFVTVLYRIFFHDVYQDYVRTSVLQMNAISAQASREQTLTFAPKWVSRIFHNKITVAYRAILTSYSKIFSIEWLFVNGTENLQRGITNHGEYYLFELPIFFIGIWTLFQKKKRESMLLFAWFMFGALPGGLSNGNYVYRSSLLIPVPILFSAYGLRYVLASLNLYKPAISRMLRIGISLYIMTAVCFYAFTYFFDYPVYASEWWSKQQNDAIRYAADHAHQYKQVYIDGGSVWATQYAFWYKANPADFHMQIQKANQSKEAGTYVFGNIVFTRMDDTLKVASSAATVFAKNSLIIVPGGKSIFPKDIPVMTFDSENGLRTVFKAIEVQ